MNSSKWILWIENNSQMLGLNYIWKENGISNTDWFCKDVKDKLQISFIKNWNNGAFSASFFER